MSATKPSVSSSRRVFMLQVAAAGVAMGTAAQAMAAAAKAAPAAKAPAAPAAPAANMVKDTDPNAIALQYASDAKKVDVKKSPKYKAGDNCLNCALYKGDAKMGDCPLFAGKKVAAGAWCSAHAKKA